MADGDWIAAREPSTAPDAVEQGLLATYITSENIRRVLTLIIACKANWWQTNHHTGTARDVATGYVGKVLSSVFGQNTASYVSLAHTISHYIETK